MFKVFIILSFFANFSTCIRVSKVTSPEVGHGLAAVWDDCTQSLYYIDFLATGQTPSILRYDYNEDRVYSAYINGHSNPSFVLPIRDCNKHKQIFAVGISHYTLIIEWDGRSPVAQVSSTLFGVEEFDTSSRICVARQSEHGRFYGGTFHNNFCSGPANSSLYMYSVEKGLQQLLTGQVVSTTGMAFDQDRGYVYHIDSCQLKITAFQADDDGNICNGKVLLDFKTLGFKAPDLAPVGLEADSTGMLYTGTYENGLIWKIDPWSSSAAPIAKLPVNTVGSVAFGGPNRDILYAIAGSSIINVTVGQVIGHNSGGTSLYKITGTNASGRKYSRMNI